MTSKSKPFYVEEYKGYIILLRTSDWDDIFKVLDNDGTLLKEFDDWYSAREWINKKQNHD